MRITEGMMMNTLRLNLNRNLYSLSSLQENLSSGKRINKPSDDPIGIISSLRYRTNLVETDTYINTIDSAKNFMETTDSSLDNVTAIIHRVRELLVGAANGTNSPQSRQDTAQEIKQLRDQLGIIANTTFGSKYIFGGTNVSNEPYDVENDQWVGNDKTMNLEISPGVTIGINSSMGDFFCTRPIQGGEIDLATDIVNPVTLLDGKNFKITVEGIEYTATITADSGWVDGTPPTSEELKNVIQDAIDTAVAGTEVLGAGKVIVGGSAETGYTIVGEPKYNMVTISAGTNDASATIMGGALPSEGVTTNLGLMQLLDRITIGIETEDQDEMQAGLGQLETKLDTLLLERARIGARVNRVDMQKQRLEATQLNYTTLLSANEDADIAQVIMDLKMKENVYRASLATGARIIQPTLVDFLK